MLATAISTPAAGPRDPVPIDNPGAWVTSKDYPSEALREGQSGTVSFRLGITASGTVSQCEIIGSSGFPQLDGAACGLIMARGKFNPALDVQGHPVPSSYSNRVRWVAPENPGKKPGLLSAFDDKAFGGLNDQQMASVIVYFVPVLMDKLVTECAAVPATKGALPIISAAQKASYERESLVARDSAVATLRKMAKLPPMISDKTFTALIAESIPPLGVDAGSCRLAGSILSELKPLPAQNLARVIVMIIRETQKKDAKKKVAN